MNRDLPILSIVKDYLREQGKKTTHDLSFYLDFAIQALREMEYDFTGIPVSKFVTLNSNDQIVIPAGCVRIIDLGIVNSANHFISLGLGNKIANARGTDSEGNTERQTSTGRLAESNGYGDFNNSLSVSRHGENLGGNFGSNGHVVYGEWSIDYERGFINVNGGLNTTDKYMIIYLQDISTINGEFLVHQFMREPIKAGIELFSKRRRKSTPRGVIQDLEHKFTWACYHMSERFSSMTQNQMMNQTRKSSAFTKS